MVRQGTTNSYYIDTQNSQVTFDKIELYIPTNSRIDDVIISPSETIEPRFDNYNSNSIYYEKKISGFDFVLVWSIGEAEVTNKNIPISISIIAVGKMVDGSLHTNYDDELILKTFIVDGTIYIINVKMTDNMKIKEKLNLLGL
jgi:hypothetical protein